MLQKEKIEPRKLGYDRPSPKFINFLNKYFGLKYYVPQNNNFVVFKDYFIDEPRKKDKYDIYNNFPNINNKNNYYTERNYENSNYYNDYSNENKAYNNFNEKKKYIQDDRDFCSKIYEEYSNYNKNKDITKMKEKEGCKDIEKKYINYQYRPSSSEYGAFFHMNK